MTSKIVVNNIESDAGISSVTFTSDIELGTKNLKGHNLESTGIVTAVSFTGSGANLTNIPAGNLSGTLPAIDGSNLTGVGASFGNSSVNTSGIITATAFVPSQGQLSHRNLIINGAMNVAQRGTSSTTEGYHTIDRIYQLYSGTDEAPTYAQADVTSGGAYDAGFRKCLKITNGNQTSGAGAGDRVRFEYRIEAQDLANSGWNYKSTSNYITLSFWVKSSVAQNFYARLYSYDGTPQAYTFETGALTANTWTKVTKTIPGNSNLQFDDNNAAGMIMSFAQYAGSNYTDAGNTMNTWAAYSGSSRYPTNTSTWYTTNDATWEFTGLQFEVGPVATPFEHRSVADELRRCQRYYEVFNPGLFVLARYSHHNGSAINQYFFKEEKEQHQHVLILELSPVLLVTQETHHLMR